MLLFSLVSFLCYIAVTERLLFSDIYVCGYLEAIIIINKLSLFIYA